jgi:hypothetical protein
MWTRDRCSGGMASFLPLESYVPVKKRMVRGSAYRRKGSCYENEAMLALSCLRHWTRDPDGPPRDRRNRDYSADGARYSDGRKSCSRSSDDCREGHTAQ